LLGLKICRGADGCLLGLKIEGICAHGLLGGLGQYGLNW